MSAAECMNNLVDAYIANPVQLGICPPNPTDATYNCLCARPSFTSWYLSTLCINCNGGQNPFSNLMAICPSFAENITATYQNSCTPYGVKEAGAAASTTGTSSSGNLSTTAMLSSSSLSPIQSPSPSPSTTPTLDSISSTSTPSSSDSSISSSNSSPTTSTLTTTGPTTVVLSMTTPSPEPSTSSKLSTLTAVAASIFPQQHSFVIPPSNETTSSPTPSPTFSPSTNETYTSTSIPSLFPPVAFSTSNSGMSTGAKAGIGVGAAAAAIGIGFVFISLLTILRRRNSRMKGPGYGRRDASYVGRGIGGGNRAGDTSTTLAEMYRDDEPQFYSGFSGSDGYGRNGSGSGLGIAGIGTGPREKMGLVPSGRIREVTVGVGEEHRGSEFATPHMRKIHHVDERISEYTEEEDFVAPQESDNVWPSPAGHDGSQNREERYSTHLQDAGVRYSITAQESNYEAAMRPKSRIYSVVDNPVLDLGQAELSDDELARLEDEERRIDDAIRESENRAKIRVERGGIGTAL